MTDTKPSALRARKYRPATIRSKGENILHYITLTIDEPTWYIAEAQRESNAMTEKLPAIPGKTAEGDIQPPAKLAHAFGSLPQRTDTITPEDMAELIRKKYGRISQEFLGHPSGYQGYEGRESSVQRLAAPTGETGEAGVEIIPPPKMILLDEYEHPNDGPFKKLQELADAGDPFVLSLLGLFAESQDAANAKAAARGLPPEFGPGSYEGPDADKTIDGACTDVTSRNSLPGPGPK